MYKSRVLYYTTHSHSQFTYKKTGLNYFYNNSIISNSPNNKNTSVVFTCTTHNSILIILKIIGVCLNYILNLKFLLYFIYVGK